MCNPIIFTVASAVVGAASKYMQYKQETKSAEAAARYNEQVAADQARVSESLAQQELSKGEADRQRVLRSGMREQGELRSLMSSSGFEMDTGSNLSLLGEGAQEWQYDANITSQNAAFAAWQHKADANRARNEQAFARYQRNNSKGSPLAQALGIGGSLLGGLGEAMSQYNATKKS